MWDPAIQASYRHRLWHSLFIGGHLIIGNLYYPASAKDSVYIRTKQGLLLNHQQYPYIAADIKLCLQLLPRERYIVSPFVEAGLSASSRQGANGVDLPSGLGAFIKIQQGIYIQLSANYRMPVSANNQPHLSYAGGLVYAWGLRTKITKAHMPDLVLGDTDNDGILDKDDACPDKPGRKNMQGCPDSDGDGIKDGEDECPDKKGSIAARGCPDRDMDGVFDWRDSCIDIAGLVRYHGCPIPDRDQDGFNDEVDECPNEYAPKNNGCPDISLKEMEQIDQSALKVQFETASAELSDSSYFHLDRIIEILKQDTLYLVEIEGHTDENGSPELNLQLSQQRADACMNYLIKKGIAESRVSSVGFGEMKPISSNDTPEGRAMNRRTEFILKK